MSKQKRYAREFQLQAAQMVVEQGFSRAETARKLGVSEWSIRKWVQRFQASGELARDGKVLEEAEELRRLRQENRQLQLENEILKKAAAYFAKESL